MTFSRLGDVALGVVAKAALRHNPNQEEDMPKYRKKPIVIEAVEITRTIQIETEEGTMTGNPGDMLITGVKGEQYPCKRDIFDATYEAADDDVRALGEVPL